MNPALLMLMAILTPVLLSLTLLLPLYLGLLSATYLIYMSSPGAASLASRYYDVSFIIEVYSRAFDTWIADPGKADWLHYTLPLLGLPALGVIIALYGTYRTARYLLNIFHLSA